MTSTSLSSLDELLHDAHPRAGDRIKLYVVEQRAFYAWEKESCPRFSIPEHEDNTGAVCRNANERVPWAHLEHACCNDCTDYYRDIFGATPELKAWKQEADARRAKITTDHSLYSDEIEPDRSLLPNVMFAFIKKDGPKPVDGRYVIPVEWKKDKK